MENKTVKILTIDDNQDNLTVLKALIIEAFPSAVVLSAPNGHKGIDIAAKEVPDVILLDIVMPGMDGYEVCRRLKADEELCDIPVVFITAIKNSKESRIKALECGAEAFLSKPIDESELTAQIRAMHKIRDASTVKKHENERLSLLVEERSRDLNRSEAKYRQIAENISDTVWTVDMGMRTTYVSPSVEKMFGESPEAYMRKPIEEKYPPASLKILREALSEELEKEKDHQSDKSRTRTIEVEQYKADKSIVWVAMHISFMRDGKGKVIGCQGVSRDITQRKHVEEQLNQNMKDLLESQRIAHLGTWRLDLATAQVVWSEELYKMYGFDPTLPPPPYTEHMKLFTPESWDRLSTSLELTRRSGTPYELELKTVTLDGSNGWMWVRGEAERDPQGNIVTLWGAAQDITQYKMVENEGKKFFLLAESSSEFIGMCDVDMNPFYVNPAGRRMVGLPDMAAACRVKVQDYYFPEDQQFITEEFFPRVLREGHGDVEIRLRHFQTGEPIWMFYYLFSVHDAGGTPVGWATVSRDITQSKLAEEALLESQAILKAAFENSQAGIAIADAPDGKLRYVNKAGLLIRNKSEEELLKNVDIHNYVDSWRIMHFDGTAYAEDEVPLARAILYGETSSEEFVIRRDDFEDRYVLANAAPIKDSNNNIKAGIVVFLDVTEKRQAEEIIRKQNDLFASLLKLLPVGVFYGGCGRRETAGRKRYGDFFNGKRDSS